MSHNQRRPNEGVMIDDIAEERIRRAKALEEDFPGSRNIPSTGIRVSQTYVQKAEDKPTVDAEKTLKQTTQKEDKSTG